MKSMKSEGYCEAVLERNEGKKKKKKKNKCLQNMWVKIYKIFLVPNWPQRPKHTTFTSSAAEVIVVIAKTHRLVEEEWLSAQQAM